MKRLITVGFMGLCISFTLIGWFLVMMFLSIVQLGTLGTTLTLIILILYSMLMVHDFAELSYKYKTNKYPWEE